MNDPSVLPPAQVDLSNKVEFLRRLLEKSLARILSSDLQNKRLNFELEQKRHGFSLMSELALAMMNDIDQKSLFSSISRRINSTLNMERTAILVPDGGCAFVPSVLRGYSREESGNLAGRKFALEGEFLEAFRPVLITGIDSASRHREVREALNLPFLISVPVHVNNEVAAVLISGRRVEQNPQNPRLGASDVETMQMVATYLMAALVNHRLRQAENLANLDPLTELPNSRGAMDALRRIISMADRYDHMAAVMFADLDNFKSINDTYGHAVGNMVLHAIADRIKCCVRESDLVGRIGGDEFIVALSQIQNVDDAGLVAGNIIQQVCRPVPIGRIECQVGVSVGISIFPKHGKDGADLLGLADEAMYEVKKHGKNSFSYTSAKKIKAVSVNAS
ncbi:MAG: sensor domain-containing diguanylate cyclase [Planctomycetota bacterium]|jgi:diguanylate cyclase (GGDEF)-like protein|nr:sensor domain-containing diguanylate cyclase [Planctomycetota bacterium]